MHRYFLLTFSLQKRVRERNKKEIIQNFHRLTLFLGKVMYHQSHIAKISVCMYIHLVKAYPDLRFIQKNVIQLKFVE